MGESESTLANAVQTFYSTLTENSIDRNGHRVVVVRCGNRYVDSERLREYLQATLYKYNVSFYYTRMIQAERDRRVEQFNRNAAAALSNGGMSEELLSYIDFLFFDLKSCLDTISQVINLAWGLGLQENKANIFSVMSQLQIIDADSAILPVWNTHRDLISDFNAYRTYITHRQLGLFIPPSQISGRVGQSIQYEPFILPDRPDTPTYNRRRVLLPFFSQIQNAIEDIIRNVLRELAEKIRV